MGEPVDFEGSNFTYLGPDGTDIVDLHVFRHDKGVSFCVRLSPDEVLNVMETGVVWVSMLTYDVPPVAVSGHALVEVDGKPSRAEPYIPRPPRRVE